MRETVNGDRSTGRTVPDIASTPVTSSTFDTVLRVGLVALLVYACARIVLPFAFILVWSAILAVILHPLHLRLATYLGGRWSALLIGLVGIAMMLGPMVIVVTSLATSLQALISSVQGHDVRLPPPPPWLDGAPLVGRKLTEIWTLVATNLPAALTKYGHLLSSPVAWLASFASGLAIGELSFVLSFAIAAVLVAHGEGGADFARRLLTRVTGSTARAVQLIELTVTTIRSVGLGVVGVALIQALFLGLGFFVIGLQAAGPLTLVALLLGIMQVPLILLSLPVVAFVFATEATQAAIVFLIWNVVVGLGDNVLRPLMLGRGLAVPMPVILLGVVGGMIVDGLLGLFVGPVLLGVSYVLLLEWLQQHPVGGQWRDGRPTS
ncbi:AI-2E family transporter [Microvirga rosea]|uniref:AI-2E family transporter n=1 Tax=Microvirga rosea TaxID=2715425 RepID=UPI001D0A314A|nr:AI-2E family transporter [Microvirga rosea]MCB8820896.1 AI-2E family transporter [Microvirga rosea]